MKKLQKLFKYVYIHFCNENLHTVTFLACVNVEHLCSLGGGNKMSLEKNYILLINIIYYIYYIKVVALWTNVALKHSRSYKESFLNMFELDFS